MYQKYQPRYTGRRNYGKTIGIAALIIVTVTFIVVYVLGILNITNKKNENAGGDGTSQQQTGQLPDTSVQPQTTPTEPVQEPDATQPGDTEPTVGNNTVARPENLVFDYVKISDIMNYTVPQGNNAVVLELKNPLGVTAADTIGSAALQTAIDKLKAQGIYVIGGVYAFRDDADAKAAPECAMHVDKDTVWLDGSMKRWLNPYLEKSRDFVLQSIDDALKLNPDEVMLLECNFPSNGRPLLIDYLGTDTVTKEEQLTDFVKLAAIKIKDTAGKKFSIAVPTGKTEAAQPAVNGTDFDQKACGADALYGVDTSRVFTLK